MEIDSCEMVTDGAFCRHKKKLIKKKFSPQSSPTAPSADTNSEQSLKKIKLIGGKKVLYTVALHVVNTEER